MGKSLGRTKYLTKLFIGILILTILTQCGGIESSWNCFGASTPIDLTLTNDEPTARVVTLYQHSEQSGFDRIGTLKVAGNSEKTICLETEGPIENGLYVYYGNATHKIYLNQTDNYQLTFSDTTFRISTPDQLEYLTDPKW